MAHVLWLLRHAMEPYTTQPVSLLPLPRQLKNWPSPWPLWIPPVTPLCVTLAQPLLSSAKPASLLKRFASSARHHTKDSMITLTWILAHAGAVHPRLPNLSEVTHSIARSLVNRAGATGDEWEPGTT
ncbi:hypothetical protein HPB50_021842 [Hyalomma asiaticum]|uniref:Uncharacterized protein n=1 Tax=Hyalomma asiaticum TaxID=266040 RepID=A0ACB7TR66_HYAAI|nr:hypothetical protein HPB50_021842 [Hyalomma asiaticum]